MKKTFYKISSFCMALLVLFSTLSFTVESHYCGDFLVDSSIFGHAESCGMNSPQMNSSKDSLKGKNCCNNEQIVLNGQNELNIASDNMFTIDQQIFVASFVYTYINLFKGLDNQITSYEEYNSPLVIRQIYKLYETYLI